MKRPNPFGEAFGLGLIAIFAPQMVRDFVPLASGDPFAGTLQLLPFLLGGFLLLHRWSERLGARPLGSAGSWGELIALGLLVFGVLGRGFLALAAGDEILAAGFALVLFHRVLRQTLALRPLLGDRLPARPSACFFFLPLLVYLAILPWSAERREPDGDEPYYLLVTHSLAYDFDAELTNNYANADWRHFLSRPIAPQPGDPVGPHGELYSRHNELLPLTLMPAYRWGGKMGALAVMAALTAALAWTTLRLGHHYFPDSPRGSLAGYALVAFAPPLLLYSYQVWIEVPAALLTMAALDRILRLDEERGWRWKEWLGIGLPVLLLPLVKIRLMLIAGPLLLMGWWYAGRPRRPVLILGALLLVVGAGILAYNQIVFANPLKIHTWQEVDPARYSLSSFLRGGLGLFFDSGFGLFGNAPIWVLLLPAALLLWLRKSILPLHLLVITLPYFIIVAPRNEWYGGWSPPFRYALLILPLLGLALVPCFERMSRAAWGALAALGGLTLVLTLVWIAVPGWTYNFADGRTYVLDALGRRLGLDVAHFFPSSIRLRQATWAWPLACLLLLALPWWGRVRAAWNPQHRSGIGRAAAWGLVALLAGAALLPLAAAHLPSRVVELEDPFVLKSGGHLHPDPWVIERGRHIGGWVLRVGETLQAPVAPGGRRVRLVLYAHYIRNQAVPFALDIKAGDRRLATWVPRKERSWVRIPVGPVDWPDGAKLALVARGEHPPGALNGAILDRVELEWQ